MKAVDGPQGIFADRAEVSTGGAMIKRAPDDPAWYRGGLWHDDMKIDVPGFWFMSWYDVSIGPNLAAYNQVRKTARPEIAREQYAVIAPTLHCQYKRATENTIVGERSMGDARLDYDELTYGWFDHFLKGENNGVLEKMPRVRYFTMGLNKWQSSDTWPPEGAQPMTLYLSSARQGQHPQRRWRAQPSRARRRRSRQFHLRPHEPRILLRRKRVLHRQRRHRRRIRPAQDGNARRTFWSTPPSPCARERK